MKLPKQSPSIDAARSQATNAGGAMPSSFPIRPPSFNAQELLTCYSICGILKGRCDNAFKDSSRSACARMFPNRQDVAKRMACQRMAEFFTDSSEGAYQAAQRRCETEVAR
jgi:hypothetical protein